MLLAGLLDELVQGFPEGQQGLALVMDDCHVIAAEPVHGCGRAGT
jgi:hypothetical protein